MISYIKLKPVTLLSLFKTLLILVFLTGCNWSSKQKVSLPRRFLKKEIIYVKLKDDKVSLQAQQKIENPRIIKLETNDHCAIAKIAKVLYAKGKYYVFDDKFKAVYIFDENGRYLNNIGSIGYSKGQYQSVDDIEFGRDTSSVYLLSNNSQKILEYNLNGTFVKDIRLGFWAMDLEIEKNGYYLFINKNVNASTGQYNLVTTDLAGKINGQYFSFPNADDIAIDFSGFLNRNKLGTLFNDTFNDTVYQITPEKMYPKYIFDFGKTSIPKSLNSYNKGVRPGLSKYTFLRKHFLELNKGFIFEIQDKNVIRTMFSDSKTKLQFELEYPSSEIVGLKDNNELISAISPEVLIMNKDKDFSINSLKHYPNLAKLIHEIRISDNPILITFNIK